MKIQITIDPDNIFAEVFTATATRFLQVCNPAGCIDDAAPYVRSILERISAYEYMTWSQGGVPFPIFGRRTIVAIDDSRIVISWKVGSPGGGTTAEGEETFIVENLANNAFSAANQVAQIITGSGFDPAKPKRKRGMRPERGAA